MAAESVAARKWILGLLRQYAPVAGGWHWQLRRQNPKRGDTGADVGFGDLFPYGIVSMQSGADTRALGGRVYSDLLYLVKIVYENGEAADEERHDAMLQSLKTMDAVLERAHTVTDGYHLTCRSQSLVEMSEVGSGVVYTHIGRIYRINVREAG